MLYQGMQVCFISVKVPLEFLSRVIWLYLLFRNNTGGLEDSLD